LDDVTVSRKHAEFRRTSEGFTVTDLGSLNGTYLNGTIVETGLLSDGDEVQVGKFKLSFYSASAGRA
jgi:pSer/pThr/pTyr-binding forkhead associated (FHA) protein